MEYQNLFEDEMSAWIGGRESVTNQLASSNVVHIDDSSLQQSVSIKKRQGGCCRETDIVGQIIRKSITLCDKFVKVVWEVIYGLQAFHYEHWFLMLLLK